MNNENDHKDFVVRTIHKYNYYEPLISIIFLKLLTKNDIGGNIGYYRLLTSLNCKEVHSFEPLYEYECYPIERNPIEHMSIFVGV